MKAQHQFMIFYLLLIFFLTAAMYYDYFWKETVDIYQNKVKQFVEPQQGDSQKSQVNQAQTGPMMPGSVGLSAWGWGTEINSQKQGHSNHHRAKLEDFFPNLDYRKAIRDSGPREISLEEQIRMLELELERKRAETVRRDQEIKDGEARLRALRKLEQERKAGEQ